MEHLLFKTGVGSGLTVVYPKLFPLGPRLKFQAALELLDTGCRGGLRFGQEHDLRGTGFFTADGAHAHVGAIWL